MGENHLTYFRIENFKRFDSFEMENLGQFNLLVGDNNVGKTSVLEGLCFYEENLGHLVWSFINIFIKRKMIKLSNGNTLPLFEDFQASNLFENLIRDISKTYSIDFRYQNDILTRSLKIDFLEHSQIKESEIYYKKEDNIFGDKTSKYWLRLLRDNHIRGIFNGYFGSAIGEVLNRRLRINMIYLNSGYDTDLLLLFYQILNDDKILRKEFLKTLSMILPNVDEIRPHKIGETEYLAIGLEDKNGLFPLTHFGDGVVKLTRILLEILDAKGKRLMIDEIETGIHFSRLKDFWKTVITLCKKYDVQLFATTHSLECQKYFVYALEELEEEDRKNARNITLIENSKGEVKTVTFDYEQFEFALEIGANTRGGDR
jgi:AAA15 family ATPase/GTPase